MNYAAANQNQNPNSKSRKPRILPCYTQGEELMNAVTHGLGAVFAVAAVTLMAGASVLQQDWVKLGASLVYGLSLVLLYLMSTLYHAVPGPRAKGVLQILDHCSIFLLIAGSYTPYTLVTLRHVGGWWLFAGLWAAALVGVVLNAIDLGRFRHLSMACYLVMGWSVVIMLEPLVASLHPMGLRLLVWGGVAYTGGVVFYALKRKRYFHGIWHLFVLAGSVLHFFSIFLYIILPA